MCRTKPKPAAAKPSATRTIEGRNKLRRAAVAATQPNTAVADAASAIPDFQSNGVAWGYHLFNAAPYALTLLVMVLTSSRSKALAGAPGELTLGK